jgi:hypothetical protein
MSLIGEQILLRAYLDSADRAPLTPRHELILKAARNDGLAGATVLRGILGFGHRGVTRHSAWSLAEHLPVVVEIVDRAERVVQFVDRSLLKLMNGGLVTLERANVMTYRHRKHDLPNSLSLGALLEPLSTVPLIETSPQMTTNQPGVLLRIFIGESDRSQGKPLYEAIVQKARELGLSGATVLRGSEGFGANSVVHKAKLLEMSTDLPIVIEMVDVEEKMKSILPWLESAVREGMITMEHVLILAYRHNPDDAPRAAP